MTRIAPVNLMYSPKTLWFDAGDLEIEVGKPIVVTTVRGTEFGTLVEPIFEATPEDLSNLKSELKPVLRAADEKDCARAQEMEEKSKETMVLFREMAEEEDETMRPVSVEYLLDGDKAIFYFEAEDRVDFRELVRKLAAKLHIRVEMRQIGVRDEARLIGGLGHCGQELCCKRLGGEFNPVSIRMAKEQNLSLNPEKISGVCGRLMCCLRYEYDAYKEFHGRCPKVGATITTPEGAAKVVDLNVPREILTIKLEDEKTVKIPLYCMDDVPEGERPKTISQEGWEQAIGAAEEVDGVANLFLTSQFSAEDKLGSAQVTRRDDSVSRRKRDAAQGSAGAASAGSVRPRAKFGREERSDRGEQRSDAKSAARHDENESMSIGSKILRRRSRNRKHAGIASDMPDVESRISGISQAEEQSSSESNRVDAKASVRPGRHSSSLRARNSNAASAMSAENKSTDNKLANSRSADNRSTDNKPAEIGSADNRPIENKTEGKGIRRSRRFGQSSRGDARGGARGQEMRNESRGESNNELRNESRSNAQTQESRGTRNDRRDRGNRAQRTHQRSNTRSETKPVEQETKINVNRNRRRRTHRGTTDES